MAVVGTPVTNPNDPSPTQNTPSLIECDDQNKLSPTVSKYYGNLTLQRMRSIRIQQSQHAKINWAILDPSGFPVDLTACGFPSDSSESSSDGSDVTGVGFRFRMRENLSLGITPEPSRTEYEVNLIDGSEGKVEICLDKCATAVPGVYFAEIGVFDNYGTDEEIMLFSNVFYVLIERGQFGGRKNQGGPPSIMEIRLHLRDSGPEESLLLDNIKFDDAEIALAISRPIQQWNETPPDLGRRYTTQNFPWRYHWLEAICANLFWMVAENFRANNLQYSAAGVQVNDQDREPNYERAAERRSAEWKQWMKRKKSEINLNMGYGSVGSTYGNSGGYA